MFNEWLLIVTLLSREPAIAMTRMPSEQACVAAGEEAKKIWPQVQVFSRYRCVEIKGTSPRRVQ